MSSTVQGGGRRRAGIASSARYGGILQREGCYCLFVLRAGMMASRLYHRRHVIPALTDHLEDKGGVTGAASFAPRSNIVNRSYGGSARSFAQPLN